GGGEDGRRFGLRFQHDACSCTASRHAEHCRRGVDLVAKTIEMGDNGVAKEG
ncbi:hypothetical protein NEUTE1DRAFT_50546, partial [Neurospora tetrasperma FGSC 2508]